mgnify:CR=1 FL=1
MNEISTRYSNLCEIENRLSGISFELTNDCNFSCSHCYRVHGANYFDRELFYKVLDEAENLGAIFVSFNGGEPTLHPDFLEFCLEILTRGLHLAVLTNGTGLSKNIVDSLVPYKTVQFQISLYGTDRESGRRITGSPSAFEQTLFTIHFLVSRGVDVIVSLLARKDTSQNLPKLIEYLNNNKIKYILMPNLTSKENGEKLTKDLFADESDLTELLSLESQRILDTLEPNSSHFPDAERVRACSAGITSLGIRVNGDIVSCQVFIRPVFGNSRFLSLSQVMSGEPRRAFLDENFYPSTCKICEVANYCMRCPADALAETGSLTGIPAESCRIARLRAKFHIDSQR